MTTEKWVWIAVTLLALFIGGAAWEGVRPKDRTIERDTVSTVVVRWDTAFVDRVWTYTRSDTITLHDTEFIPVQVYSMDTTRPITATVTNGTDTVDALTYVSIRSDFISAPFNEFRNVQVSLAPMRVSFKTREQARIVYEEMRGGLGAEWIQEFGGPGGFKATGYIPINSWFSFTPSVTVGSLSGAGGGIFVHW